MSLHVLRNYWNGNGKTIVPKRKSWTSGNDHPILLWRALGQREIAHLCLSIPFLSILGKQPFLAQKLKAPRSNPTKVDGTDKAGPGVAGYDQGGFSVLLERTV